MPVRVNGDGSSKRLTEGYPFGPLTSLKAMPGTPPAIVSACRAAIKSAAARLGARRVNAVSAGPMRPYQAGLQAPIYVRIEYARQVREAKVTCRLDAARRVTAVI
ncbi:SDR family oxidoreductase [Mesorhizobium sp. CU2]|nr:SDR family oxidoreductase [Mesorhizobium sp. CU3]TPO08863.1 SDR family oxidoreductase [Mesorhizobium sp. CU2]